MISIAIVDDEERERQKLRECLTFIEDDGMKFDVSEFGDAEEFLMKYEPGYDIVFLDIQLGRTNGIDAAKLLRKVDRTVIIIFVTGMAQLAGKGYEVEAFDFIVKPIDKPSFALKVKRALVRLAPGCKAKILIRQDGDLISLNVNTLRYIESDGHYTVYHSPEGAFKEYITLSSAEKKVGQFGAFYRCNRGQMVNLKYVTAIRKDLVVLDGKKELSIARTQRNAFIQAYAEYMGGVR